MSNPFMGAALPDGSRSNCEPELSYLSLTKNNGSWGLESLRDEIGCTEIAT